VSFYELLLLLHVLAAFALVAAVVVFWTMTLVAWRGTTAGAAIFTTLARPASILVIAGSVLTLVFGVWLAIYVDGYELWDGWIVASLVLWLVATGAGERGGRILGEPSAVTDPARRRPGLALQVVSTVGVLAVLVLMIYKPGA
jgi:uncharacterized membrane protein